MKVDDSETKKVTTTALRASSQSLYDQLGGADVVQALVDEMYHGIFTDDELGDFFRHTDKEK